LLIPLLVAAQFHGTFVVSDHTELRARDARGDPNGPYFDVMTTPRGALTYGSRRADYRLSYSPMLTMPDIFRQLSPEVLHNASAGADYRVSRFFRLQFAEDGSYGDRNFSYLATPAATDPATSAGTTPPAPATPSQLLPSLQTLHFGSSNSSVRWQAQPSRHWNFGSGLAYSISGGLDADSRVSIPIQKGPRGEVFVNHALDRRDFVGVDVSAHRTEFTATRCSLTDATLDCRPDLRFLEEHVYWSRVLERSTNITFGAGVSHVSSRQKTEESFRLVHYPNVFVSGTHSLHWRGRWVLGADASLAPVIDFRTGLADPRAQLNASALWNRARRTTIRVSGGVVQSLPPGEARTVTLVSNNTELGYKLDRRWTMSGGVRLTWQKEPNFDSVLAGQLFVGLSFEEPPLRF
jgi:hypothetical protein